MAKTAAKKGKKAAIACARDKWMFFGKCTSDDLMKRFGCRDRNHVFLGDSCSLCEFTGNICYDCPLAKSGNHCLFSDSSVYHVAAYLFDNWTSNPTKTNFKKFQAKARKLARIIGRLK